MSNIKLIEERNTSEYTMNVYEIDYKWGKVKSTHFIRPNNVIGDLMLRTVINRWHNTDGKFRSTKQYQIVKDNVIIASLWANIRFDQEKGLEIIENQEAVKNFFYAFSLHKKLELLMNMKDVVAQSPMPNAQA